jgi:LmbE family N-acetylglucosaminyl deacetylase
MPDTAENSNVALAIAAHPDDGDFGCAGYTSQLAARGVDVYFLVCTNGAKGTSDRAMMRERLIALRQEEQREACRRMGAKDVFFLDHEDSELTYDRDLLEQLVRFIRVLRPNTVLTRPDRHHHAGRFINHADHRTTGTAALDAIYQQRATISTSRARRGLEPHKVREVLLWGTNQPNFDVDITPEVDRKIYALSAHVTQFEDKDEFINFARERWKADDGRYLERFRRIELQF